MGEATCAGLTSWKYAVSNPYMDGQRLFLTSLSSLIEQQYASVESLVSEQPYLRIHCSPDIQERPRKGRLNKVCSSLTCRCPVTGGLFIYTGRKKSKFVSKKHSFRFASWNVRTCLLYTSPSPRDS